MAYIINKTDGTLLATVADGTVDTTSCSLTLIGKNYSGYGTFFNDNLVHIIENFADSSSPTAPLDGQLWWDTAGNLKVYNGATFLGIAGITVVANTAPAGSVTGNFWWDEYGKQLKVYDGASWVLVGPANSSNTGISGVYVGNITDSDSNQHVATNIWVDSTLVAIVSNAGSYTPLTSITGFTSVKPGFNLASNANVALTSCLWGTANNATYLGNVIATQYARLDQDNTFATNVIVNGNLRIGSSEYLVVNVASGNARITNVNNNGNLTLRTNSAGTISDNLLVDAATGNISLYGNISASKSISITGNASAGNVVVNSLVSSQNLITSGNIKFSGSEDLANAAAANLEVMTSYFTTTTTETATLAAGTEGLIKTFVMAGDGGDMVITVTNPGWGGAGTITFSSVGSGVTLQYINSKWYCIGNNGAAFA